MNREVHTKNLRINFKGMNTKQQFLIPKLETNQKPKSLMLSSTQFKLNINDAIFSEIDIKLRKNKSNKKLRKKTNCIPSSCYRYDSLPWIGRRVQKVLGVIRERERERVTN